MKTCLARTAALLLTLVLLISAMPLALAAGRMDFRVIEEAGDTDQNAIYVVTKPQFYTGSVSRFVGDYAVYQDIYSGCHGITDYGGRIVCSPDPEGPDPYTVVGKNLFLTSVDAYHSGFLYDFNRTKLYDGLLNPDRVSALTDAVSGEALGFRIGDPARWWEDQSATLGAWDGTLFPNAVGAVQNGLVCRKMNKGWSLWEAFGERRLPDDYEYLSFTDTDVLLARQNGVYRLIRTDGTALNDQTYDEAQKIIGAFPALIVCKDKKYGLLKGDGSELAPMRFDQLEQIPMEEEDSDFFAFQATADGASAYYIATVSGIQTLEEWALAHQALLRKDWHLLPDPSGYSKLVDDQKQPLIPDPIWLIQQGGSGLAIFFPEAYVTRFYDWDLKLLAEIEGRPSSHTPQAVAFSETTEGGTTNTVFYDLSGTKLRTVSGASVGFTDANTLALQRADGMYAFADGRGNLLTRYVYPYVIPISSGFVGLRYPYYITQKEAGKAYEIIDGHTGSNAVSAKCTVSDHSAILPEGSYFPIYLEGKTGFARLTARDESPFRDVGLEKWYGQSVKFCYNAGLMNGEGSGRFVPNGDMTRAMLVQVLYNISGEKTSAHGFADVPDKAWYADAVNWAAANHIVEGASKTRFDPNALVTREQMVAILYRYAKTFGVSFAKSADLSRYTDRSRISGYAVEAMAWAVGNGVIKGSTSTTISPKGTATRAEVATVLMRFVRLMAGE